jgi:hypothetical protein
MVVAQWTPPAVVDRHKGGELAYFAGDTLEEAIEAASRVSVGFAARAQIVCRWAGRGAGV